jgi:hypothetical protein
LIFLVGTPNSDIEIRKSGIRILNLILTTDLQIVLNEIPIECARYKHIDYSGSYEYPDSE